MKELIPKDFENLHAWKIRNGLSNSTISSQYFFCIDNRMLFIKKSRKYYKLMASSQCGFEPLYRESCLDVVAGDTDLSEIIKLFYGYCFRLLEVINELH